MTCHRTQTPLYPLRFEPIYQYRLWGGRRLADVLAAPLPATARSAKRGCSATAMTIRAVLPMDRLKGRAIGQLMEQSPEQLLGKLAGRFRRFPLLLKFLDAREMLSVQVHPAGCAYGPAARGRDRKDRSVGRAGSGDKEPYLCGPEAGHHSRRSAAGARRTGRWRTIWSCFTPKPGDAVFLPAGTVHSLGGDIVVFEVQENSDVTFRLYDWDHVDAKTGQPRALQVDQALACIDFVDGAAGPVAPVVEATTPVRARATLSL